MSRSLLAQNPRTLPAPEQGRARELGVSLFAYVCGSTFLLALLLVIRRHNTRQKYGQDFVVLPPQNFEHHIIARLQLGYRFAIVLHRNHRFPVDFSDHVAASESGII